MTHFYEMDWNAKWDWESFPGFGSKAIESPKKRQMVDWTINDDGEIDAGSFNLSTGGGNSDASGSDGGNVSSAKSSISASHNSRKEGMQNPHFRLRTFNDIPGNFSNKMELKGAEVPETSPPLEVSISSVEPLIGLKLGKRMYFENSGALGNDKSASSLKKTKPSGQNLHVRCVVEGCNIDLSTAKEYHRKHKVCDSHSKCPKVIVGGFERRFCQQCSRFHNLSEFDEEKRSCRRRLSDHNARRRKPLQESVQFNSGRFSSPFYGARRQRTNFLFNSASLIHSRNLAITSSDSTHNSNFTLTRGCSSNFGDRVSSEQMQMQGIKLPHLINVQSNAAKGLVASKSSVTEVLNSGCKESQFPSSSQSDAAPECRRALSLLSSNPWASCGPQTMALNHLTHEKDTQPMMLHGEGRPLSSSDIWLPSHQPSTHPARLHSFAANANFQEVQLFITPEDTDFYSTILN